MIETWGSITSFSSRTFIIRFTTYKNPSSSSFFLSIIRICSFTNTNTQKIYQISLSFFLSFINNSPFVFMNKKENVPYFDDDTSAF